MLTASEVGKSTARDAEAATSFTRSNVHSLSLPFSSLLFSSLLFAFLPFASLPFPFLPFLSLPSFLLRAEHLPARSCPKVSLSFPHGGPKSPFRAVAHIPVTRFSGDVSHDEEDGTHASCAVCLEDYQDGEELRVLVCRHQFHRTCIDPWLMTKRSCCPVW